MNMFDSYRKWRQTVRKEERKACEALELDFGESTLRQWESFINEQRRILLSTLEGWHWWNRRKKRECVRAPHIGWMGKQLSMIAAALRERNVTSDEVARIQNGVQRLLTDIRHHCAQLETVDNLSADAELLRGIAVLLTTLREKEAELLTPTNR